MLMQRIFSVLRKSAVVPAPVTATATAAADTNAPAQAATGAQIVDLSLHRNNPVRVSAADACEVEPARVRIRGLMNAPEIERFFRENHFGLGRHNGANYRSLEALSLGKRSLIAEFRNILDDLAERRKEKARRLRLEGLAVEGVSQTLLRQLQLAEEELQRDVHKLREQMDLAEQEAGWIAAALTRYEIGFRKGLTEALQFELLSDEAR